jgi:hypothetical protein
MNRTCARGLFLLTLLLSGCSSLEVSDETRRAINDVMIWNVNTMNNTLNSVRQAPPPYTGIVPIYSGQRR